MVSSILDSSSESKCACCCFSLILSVSDPEEYACLPASQLRLGPVRSRPSSEKKKTLRHDVKASPMSHATFTTKRRQKIIALFIQLSIRCISTSFALYYRTNYR